MKKDVLVGFIMDGRAGGIDKYLLNFLHQVCNADVRIDFLTTKVDEELKNKLSAYGSELYEIPSLRHPMRQYRAVCELLKKHQYNVTYLNISTAINCIAAFAAQRCHIETRILHSHSSGNDCNNPLKRFALNTAHKICRLWLYKTGNKYLACSQKAGMWLFPSWVVNSSRLEIVNNAIDSSLYAYNPKVRADIREKLGLKDRHVIGFVGNFCYAKNLDFLINVFAVIFKQHPDYLLMLAGDGPDYLTIKNKVTELGIQDGILFLGRRNDVSMLLQGIDVFVLPSRFEGLPIVGIEAQASGLMCVFSDAVSTEVQVTDNCKFISLAQPLEFWSDTIISMTSYNRQDQSTRIKENNFDCALQQNQLKGIID